MNEQSDQFVHTSLRKYKYTPNLESTPDHIEEQEMETTELQKKYPVPKEITPEQWWDLYTKLNNSLVQVKDQCKGLKGTVAPQTIVDGSTQRLDDIKGNISALETRINVMANVIIAQDKEIQDLRQEVTQLRRAKSKNKIKIIG